MERELRQRAAQAQRSESSGTARAVPPLGVPAVLALQGAAGNRAVSSVLGRSPAFALATSGRASEVPRRAEMERAFGTGFGDVQAHLGGAEATAGLGALGARAATSRATVAFKEANPPADVVAHELAHVVQQRRRGGGAVGAEAAAERAAGAFAAGRPVPDVGAARAGEVQLLADQSVTTAGGQWGTTNYAAVSNLHSGGALIDLWFKAGSPIISKQIRLVQTVTGSYQSVEAGPMVPDPNDDHGGALELGPDSRDPGRAIDQDRAGKGHSLPFTNPEYAVDYGPGGGASTDLGDPTAAGAGTNGSRDGTSEPIRATLHDKPIRSYAVDGQLWRQTFEVTALVVEGPFSGLYLGSVTWGWKNAWDKDEHGMPMNPTVQLLPTPIAVVREGSPSSAFMEAAERWNAQKFTDSSTGAEYDTVDLPLEVDPVVLSTLEVANLLAAARRAGTQDERQQFRAGLLERELRKRNVAIRVAVAKTGDLIGPDNVYARVAGVRTPVQRLGAGETHDFLLSLSEFAALPFTDPVQVDVLDEDTFGDDDLVAGLVWSAPFDYVTATGTGGDAEYTVTVNYA